MEGGDEGCASGSMGAKRINTCFGWGGHVRNAGNVVICLIPATIRDSPLLSILGEQKVIANQFLLLLR